MALTTQERATLLAAVDAVTEVPAPPPPPPPPPPGPPPVGTVLYFSQEAHASNANPGTVELPKRNLTSTGANDLPAGATLLFRRGDTWDNMTQLLENPNSTAASPITFDAYGTGERPVFRTPANNMFHIGGNWGNTYQDGGYVLRNLKLDGMGTAEWGLWFVLNVRDVLVEECEITGFRIGINSNDSETPGVDGVTIRNNWIHHNRAMGLLGHYDDLLIEHNLFEANNFSGSTFDHGTYIGGGHNITLRGNHYLRNSALNGVGYGGNMTFHGQIDGLLIEGNTIEQDSSAPGCWLMSLTHGYSSPEWFRNAVIRNNTLINGGNTVMAVQSAVGVLIEGNTIINTQGTSQTAFAVGAAPSTKGDDPNNGAIVRNNIIRLSNGSSGTVVNFVNAPGSVQENNTVEVA